MVMKVVTPPMISRHTKEDVEKVRSA